MLVEETLEAFLEGKEPPDNVRRFFVVFDLRARFNAHRHPVIFVAEMGEHVASCVKWHWKQGPGSGIQAAEFLLRGAEKVGFSNSTKHEWPLLQKLVPQFARLGNMTKKRYEVKQ